jgi:hypothetical protein
VRRHLASACLAAAYLVTALLVAAALAGCVSGPGPTYPPLGATPPAAGEATAAAQAQVIRALAAAGLEAAPSARPYRPPETARLAAAPRSVVRVTLPEDPAGGDIVVYALGAPEAARAAAEDQAAYVASGPGGIQFPPGSRFVVRVVGSSVVFFTWTPGASPDPRTPEIAAALETLGLGVAG